MRQSPVLLGDVPLAHSHRDVRATVCSNIWTSPIPDWVASCLSPDFSLRPQLLGELHLFVPRQSLDCFILGQAPWHVRMPKASTCPTLVPEQPQVSSPWGLGWKSPCPSSRRPYNYHSWFASHLNIQPSKMQPNNSLQSRKASSNNTIFASKEHTVCLQEM